MLRQGTRAQVMHGTALKTTGGLRKNDLKYNKQGKIVSRLLSTKAKKEKRLERAGWTVRKGEFGAVQMKGGDSFELGNKVNSKYITTNPIKNTKKAVTPMPKELVHLSPNNTKEYNASSTSPFASTCVKINNDGIIEILKLMYKKYELGQVPKDLNVQPSRKLVMYLGKQPKVFKSYIESNQLWGSKLKQVLQNYEKYTSIANLNNNTNIRGIVLNEDNIREQTLWKLALAENNKNISTSSTPCQIKLKVKGKVLTNSTFNVDLPENYVSNITLYRTEIMKIINMKFLTQKLQKNYRISVLNNKDITKQGNQITVKAIERKK